MLNRKTVLILAVATLALALAAVFSRQDSTAIVGQGEPLFPELMSRINDAGQVLGTSSDGTFTISRRDDGWVVKEKFDYPADADKVRRLLLGTAQLKRIEPKTRKPELYAQLGVEDVDADGSESLKFTLKNTGGDALADFILGTRRPATGDPGLSEYYVRVAGDSQAWLVEGKLPEDKNPINWIDRDILEIEPKRVRAVRVTYADGRKLIVRRDSPDAGDFQLAGLPKGAEIKDVYAVNGIGNGLTNLSLDDVRPASSVQREKTKAAMSVVMTTFDGLRIKMRTRKKDKQNLALFSAAFDPSLVYQDPEADKSVTGGDEEDTGKQGTRKGPDAVKQEVETLNARWQAWVYVIPQYRVDSIAKKKSDLIKFSKKQDSRKTAGS